MSAAPGLAPQNLRLTGIPGPDPEPPDISVEMEPDAEDTPDIDEKGNILRIRHGDDTVTVSLDGKPFGNVNAANEGPQQWFDNLVDKIGGSELSRITEDLLQGIEDDLTSRKEWIQDRAAGMKLLGLKIEQPLQYVNFRD